MPSASAPRSPLPSPHSSTTLSSHSPTSEYASRLHPHHQQYEHDIAPRHQYTPPTGETWVVLNCGVQLMCVVADWQVGDRASLRLAESHSVPPHVLPPMALPPQPQHYQAHTQALGYPSVPFAIPIAAYAPPVLPAAPKRQMEQSDEESGSKSKKVRSNARPAKAPETNGVPLHDPHILSALLTPSQRNRGAVTAPRNVTRLLR